MAATTTAPAEAAVVELGEIDEALAATIERSLATGGRLPLHRDGRPVAAVLPITVTARLDRFDAEWEADFAIFHEIGAAFREVDPEEIELETSRALAEVRAEIRVERAAGVLR